MSMIVYAIDNAPSRMACIPWADTVWSANSGWWFTASPDWIPSIGWIDGTTWLTLPMSDEPPLRPIPASVGIGRPMLSELTEYRLVITGLFRMLS